MPLTLDASVGGANSNAYATVAEAQSLIDYRVSDAATVAWAGLTADQKIQAMVTATRDIDSIQDDFIGERASSSQRLEWPRVSAGDWPSSALPQPLKDANIELALSYATVFATPEDVLSDDQVEGNIKRKKTDVLETEYFSPQGTAEATSVTRFPTIVQRLLEPLLRNEDDAAWGSADVTRGS